jgi:kynurenine formamidase
MLEAVLSGKVRVIDLAYAINDKLLAWPGDERYFEARDNATFAKHGMFTRSFWMLEHYGTHLDAPIHFAPGKASVEQIAAQRFFGPAVVLDIQDQAGQNADYQAPVQLLDEWEARHGAMQRGAIVLLRTGWASRWPDRVRYRNQDASGRMHFPGFSIPLVERCVQRGVSGIGCDTMSPDRGASEDFAVHHLALGAGLYHLENLSDLSALPEAGAWLIVAPIKLEGGSGGPVRVFALLP